MKCGLIIDFLETHEASALEVWGRYQLEQVLSDLWLGSGILRNRIDWAAKLELLNQQKLKNGIDYEDWGNAKIRATDKMYDLLEKRMRAPDDPGAPLDTDVITGLGVKMQSTWFKEWMPSATAIQRARFEPPSYGRAALRGAYVEQHGRTPSEYKTLGRPKVTVDWLGAQRSNQETIWPLFPGREVYPDDHDWRKDAGEFGN